MEIHLSPNSIIIIQLNKSSVRDRSFSRKLKVNGLSFGVRLAAHVSFARHGRALAGESPEHAQVVGNV